MRYRSVCGPGVLLLVLTGGGAAAAAQLPPAGDVDTAEVNCLASMIYRRSADDPQAPHDVIAWTVRNRRERDRVTYCDIAGETLPPWSGLDLDALARRDLQSDAEASALLAAYRAELAKYQAAQIVAYKVMYGWLDEDPTQGATEFAVRDEQQP